MPPFTGVDAVREAGGLANPTGFIPVDDEYRHPEHRDVFAAGVAVAIATPDPAPVDAGVPKTGQMTEVMAKVAARNIAADIDGSAGRRLPLEDLGAICVLDAGDSGVVFTPMRRGPTPVSVTSPSPPLVDPAAVEVGSATATSTARSLDTVAHRGGRASAAVAHVVVGRFGDRIRGRCVATASAQR